MEIRRAGVLLLQRVLSELYDSDVVQGTSAETEVQTGFHQPRYIPVPQRSKWTARARPHSVPLVCPWTSHSKYLAGFESQSPR